MPKKPVRPMPAGPKPGHSGHPGCPTGARAGPQSSPATRIINPIHTFTVLVVFELKNAKKDPDGLARPDRLPTAAISIVIGKTTKATLVKEVIAASNHINWKSYYKDFAPDSDSVGGNAPASIVAPSEDNIAILWHLLPRGNGAAFGSTYLNTINDDGLWTCVHKMSIRENCGLPQDYISCEIECATGAVPGTAAKATAELLDTVSDSGVGKLTEAHPSIPDSGNDLADPFTTSSNSRSLGFGLGNIWNTTTAHYLPTSIPTYFMPQRKKQQQHPIRTPRAPGADLDAGFDWDGKEPSFQKDGKKNPFGFTLPAFSITPELMASIRDPRPVPTMQQYYFQPLPITPKLGCSALGPSSPLLEDDIVFKGRRSAMGFSRTPSRGDRPTPAQDKDESGARGGGAPLNRET